MNTKRKTSRQPGLAGAGLHVAPIARVARRYNALFGRYFVAFASVFAAVFLSWATLSFTGETPLVFFVIAVVISAGRRTSAGLLATVLSVYAILLLFKDSISIAVATSNLLALFIVIAIVINGVCYKLHQKNRELTRRNATLIEAKAAIEAVNERLVDHAESLADANATLAEQRFALSQSHEQLRQLAYGLSVQMQDSLARSKAAYVDDNPERASELIKAEIHRMDTLVSDFSQVC